MARFYWGSNERCVFVCQAGSLAGDPQAWLGLVDVHRYQPHTKHYEYALEIQPGSYENWGRPKFPGESRRLSWVEDFQMYARGSGCKIDVT